MLYELPKLPFEKKDLEPVMSEQTIDFHYGKHHAAYVNNLNLLIKGTTFENQDLKSIIILGEGAIFNNAAQAWNHTFFFEALTEPGTGGEPSEKLSEAIVKQWGSIDAFKKEFTAAGASIFGSGWVWLSVDKDHKLVITKESNANNPLPAGYKPLLTFDVWEHAYYLDYQNRRPDYLNELWKIVNWKVVSQRFEQE